MGCGNVRLIGLFRDGYGDECYDKYGPSLGNGHAIAKVFGVISCLFGGIVLEIMTLGLFLPLPVRLWRTVTVIRVLAPFQLFTFTIFMNCPDYCECLIGIGAASALMAFILWIVAGMLSCRMPMVEKAVIPPCNNSGGGCWPVSVEESELSAPPAPGTTTITEEVVHPEQ